ncbi:MAG: TRAP transporter substrate-binding protein [Spirochaetales bacterium]|jgi:tripartite ATP-independent transporter DctP family solute receptor|nr:TRAP transporter substrate-binding protein [Spirochaetales bacterium]
MKKILGFVMVLAVLASFAFAGGGSEPAASASAKLQFKLAENQPKGNPITEAMFRFADLVKQKTGGAVEIEVYSDAQLGNENETIDQVQAGTLDFARINTSAIASTADEMSLYTLPYIFVSFEHKYKVLDGDIGKASVAALEKYNMVGLEFWEAGSRHFYTTKVPIKSLSDLKGLKIRVQQSEVAIKMVELLGAKATPMAYGEVFQGLQTGVIDGAENDFVSYYTSGHYEVAKNLCLDGHMAPPALVIASAPSFNKMDTTRQQAVREAAREAAVWQRKAMNDFQNESRKAVEAAGSKIYDVNVLDFQNAVKAIYDMYPQFAKQIDGIKALQ